MKERTKRKGMLLIIKEKNLMGEGGGGDSIGMLSL